MALLFKRKPKHQVSDFISISISCCHMVRNYGYSFTLYKKDKWYLKCLCFINDHMDEVKIEKISVSDDDANMALQIIKDENLILEAERFKKINPRFFALDATTYGFNLEFRDGIIKTTTFCQSSLEKLFHDLAKKYYEGEIEK